VGKGTSGPSAGGADRLLREGLPGIELLPSFLARCPRDSLSLSRRERHAQVLDETPLLLRHLCY
jgi:hypothetical protein